VGNLVDCICRVIGAQLDSAKLVMIPLLLRLWIRSVGSVIRCRCDTSPPRRLMLKADAKY
jgi:hypothetical protein